MGSNRSVQFQLFSSIGSSHPAPPPHLLVVDAGAPLAGDVGFFVAGVVRSLAPLFIAKMTTSRSERSGSNTVNFMPAFGWNAVCLPGFQSFISAASAFENRQLGRRDPINCG